MNANYFTTAILFSVVFECCRCSSFINCNDTAPVQMHFSFPDILRVTVGKSLSLNAGATVKETFPPAFLVQHTMERRFLGSWYKLPCIGQQGHGKECITEMPCKIFIEMGFNGTCPIQPGEYRQRISIPVPKFHVPFWLLDGMYRAVVRGWDLDKKKLWFCGSLIQYIENGAGKQAQALE